MSLRDFFLNLYLKTIKNFSHGKGYGKKNKLINLTVRGIESSLKTNYAEVWAGKMFLHPNDVLRNFRFFSVNARQTDFKI